MEQDKKLESLLFPYPIYPPHTGRRFMGIRFGKTVSRLILLLLAFSTFVVGLTAFYFYAEAAAFLFKPKQPTPETTQKLTSTWDAAPPVSLPSPTFSEQTTDTSQPACKNCVQDDICGLCEPVTGEYENYTYNYAMTIPDELRALKPPSPALEYGFIAGLPSEPGATIEVEGKFNDDNWNSLNEAVNAHIEYLKAGAKDVTVLKRVAARLGKRSAIRYVVRYASLSTGVYMIEDKTIALRKENRPRAYWAIYSVSMRTPETRYERHIDTLERVLKRWKETEAHGC